jgi:hypothetical protein
MTCFDHRNLKLFTNNNEGVIYFTMEVPVKG